MRDTRSLFIAFGHNANARCVIARPALALGLSEKLALRSLNGIILRRGALCGRSNDRRRTSRNSPNRS